MLVVVLVLGTAQPSRGRFFEDDDEDDYEHDTNCMATITYDPLYLRGIEYFNACDFFESHEVWEELWTDCQGPDRKFFQGLIQAAVALHHFGNGNIRGARKLYHSSRSYLESYRPRHLGLDLERFFHELETCFAQVLANQEEFPQIAITPDLIPEIHLDPPPE